MCNCGYLIVTSSDERCEIVGIRDWAFLLVRSNSVFGGSCRLGSQGDCHVILSFSGTANVKVISKSAFVDVSVAKIWRWCRKSSLHNSLEIEQWLAQGKELTGAGYVFEKGLRYNICRLWAPSRFEQHDPIRMPVAREMSKQSSKFLLNMTA